ncbi:hypothetical protein F4827_002966 [Paraburkholderia bannensis]|uniref:Uncharacterized protein n=1 Tax=Paraburkholderia bannensis TaxID=765414 RepID=A0A7W9TXA4_9BURK|nr:MULTISPECIES: hypothetical protein [Paraburkholderia]MBB3258098.1 hypothetical protein [Paraburkholderia sp. WP4_3_2]MBB6103111.1 hypothetical protein [Paraburkholderia bannensis]
MNTDQRIDGIQQAQNYDDLHTAMDGFLDEAQARYPALEQAGELKACIGGSAFAQAVVALKQYQAATGETYPRAQRVIKAAAVKHAALGGAPGGGPTCASSPQPESGTGA